METMRGVFIGLGSNLGDKEGNIKQALLLLTEGGAEPILLSSLYLTEPVGFSDQPWFLNLVAEVETKLSPRELLSLAGKVEKELGRVRSIKDGPRTIDIDILLYRDQLVEEKNLIIPHPRLHLRRFVLSPLVEIAPDFVHPVLKKTVSGILNDLSDPARVIQMGKIHLPEIE
jgi:2-amino-4-hydroxy-6-hydroxymethyldihydropteridine diphosphokinase